MNIFKIIIILILYNKKIILINSKMHQSLHVKHLSYLQEYLPKHNNCMHIWIKGQQENK